VSRALVDGLIPLYCFYNFEHAPNEFSQMANPCAHTYRQPSFWGCSIAFPGDVKNAGSDKLSVLKSHMYPWHTLVCDAGTRDLPGAVGGFVERERPSFSLSEREIPSHVAALIESSDQRRSSKEPSFLDESYWHQIGKPADELPSGIAIYRDVRSAEEIERDGE
jgi:hypothetical protein